MWPRLPHPDRDLLPPRLQSDVNQVRPVWLRRPDSNQPRLMWLRHRDQDQLRRLHPRLRLLLSQHLHLSLKELPRPPEVAQLDQAVTRRNTSPGG